MKKTNLEKVYDEIHQLKSILESEEDSGRYSTEDRHEIYEARYDILGAAQTLGALNARLKRQAGVH